MDESNEGIAKIMRSMGITEYDSAVMNAVDEYARKFAAELLCDAKDYASYAGHSEIAVNDITLSLKLSDMRVMGIDPKDTIINTVKDDINKQDLIDLLDPESVQIRYPSKTLLQQTYNYVPSSDRDKKTSGFDSSSFIKTSGVGNINSNNNNNSSSSSSSSSNSSNNSNNGMVFDSGGKFAGMNISGNQPVKVLGSATGFRDEENS